MSTNKTDKKSKAISLAAANTYSSYQLAADTLASKDPKRQMLLCILHTYEWLRERFSSFTISELDYPAPDKCEASRAKGEALSWEDIKAFEITSPYYLKVMSIPDYGIWALQLREPDNGNSGRDPVQGRIYETNIGFKLDDNCVHCGFKTVVTDPAGHKKKSEVFRLGCIKRIAEDKEVGLCQCYKLQGGAIKLENVNVFKALRAWLESPKRTLPAVVYSKTAGEKNSAANDISRAPSVQEFMAKRAAMFDNFSNIPRPGRIEIINLKDYPLVEKVAEHKMGYAQIFELDEALSKVFSDSGYFAFDGPMLIIFEPKCFGGKRTEYHLMEFDGGDVKYVNTMLTEYSQEKDITFEACFVPEAKAIEKDIHTKQLKANRELKAAIEEEKRAGNVKAKEALLEAKKKIDELVRQNERLENELSSIKEKQKNASYDTDLIEEIQRLSAIIDAKDFELGRYHSLERRPKAAADVAKWVESEFEGKLIFHKKAVDLMAALGPNSADISLICDALEYLACEYRDSLLQRISEDERNSLCSKKYGRPFSVEPLQYESPSSLSKDYKIKYNQGFAGKPVETPLDLHLKIGNKNEDLIRIYFLYDKEKQLIVVGSLPKHLPTLGYK